MMAQQELSSRHVLMSATTPGVELVIGRMTFGRRIELMRLIRDLAAKLEFFQAGQDASNRMEASLLGAEIDRIYVEWGIEEVRGLLIDGEPATPRALVDRGPEPLFFEALAAIKAECGLTETERKN
jgi:hypothetical protein